MLRLVALPVVLSLAQLLPQGDSLARDRVIGPLGTRLDSQLTRFEDYGFWGTVLVVRDSEVVLLKGYGLANADRRVRNSAATRFELNSMTKMFTGVAILQLEAAGRLRVSDPVDRSLGPFPAAKGATIGQLANHTAGLVVAGTVLAQDTRDAFVGDVKRTPRESPPGERYRYTNAGSPVAPHGIEDHHAFDHAADRPQPPVPVVSLANRFVERLVVNVVQTPSPSRSCLDGPDESSGYES
jgi:CubicO group peptidase (beta-lactamase class C family)